MGQHLQFKKKNVRHCEEGDIGDDTKRLEARVGRWTYSPCSPSSSDKRELSAAGTGSERLTVSPPWARSEK